MQGPLVPKSLEDLGPEKAWSRSGLPFLRPSRPVGWASDRGVHPSPAAGSFWAAPRGRGGAAGGGDWPLPSSGCSPTLRPRPAPGLKPASCGCSCSSDLSRTEERDPSCRLPTPCDTHYRNDCVFSLITHYFYAERRLNEGKNNSNNISGAANSYT